MGQMTQQRWKTAGWLCVGLCVVFAALSLVLAFQGAGPGTPVTVPGGLGIAPIPLLPPAFGLLRSVVFGVLAGVAFFTGLACFLGSAVVEARQQRAEIIRLLEGRGTEG
jgi:hypothetical protein